MIVVLTFCMNAYAEEPPAVTRAPSMHVGLNLGPGVGLEPTGGTVFWVGPELSTRYFQLPLLFGFGEGGTKMIDLIPRIKYDFEVVRNLFIGPFGGLRLDLAFAGGETMFDVGLEIGGRATYWFTPRLGAYIEPVGVGLSFFRYLTGGAGTHTDFVAIYRMYIGGAYRF